MNQTPLVSHGITLSEIIADLAGVSETAVDLEISACLLQLLADPPYDFTNLIKDLHTKNQRKSGASRVAWSLRSASLLLRREREREREREDAPGMEDGLEGRQMRCLPW